MIDFRIQMASRDDEWDTFERTLKNMDLPAEGTDPYRQALNSDEAFRAVYNWYRAMPLWRNLDLESVKMPAMFIWPPKAGNVSRETAEANEKPNGVRS